MAHVLAGRNGLVILGTALWLVLVGALTSAADGRSGGRAAVSAARTVSSLPITFCLRQGDNYIGADDTDMDKWLPDKTNGTDPKLRVRNDNARNALIRFTVPELPADPDWVVGRARLRLHVNYRSAAFPMTVGLYRVRRTWNSNYASWNDAAEDTSWNVPGCNGLPDRVQETTVRADAIVESEWVEFDVSQDVLLWMTNPPENHGYLARGESEYTVQYDFDSSEALNRLYRPELCITYYEVTPTPTITHTPTDTPTPTMTPTASPTATPNTGGVYGVVYDDQNADGQREAGEPPLSGVQVILRMPAGQPLTFATTDGEGRYDLGALTPGLYWLQEVDPPGYISTTLNDWMVRVYANYRMEVNFGDRLTVTSTPTPTATVSATATARTTATPTATPTSAMGTIYGRVWHDINGNAQRDAGEPPLRGVQIVLKTPIGQLLQLQITDDAGIYHLDPIWPGQYWLQELDPAGFVSTTANDWMVSVPANGVLEINFGDRIAPSGTPTWTPTATATATPSAQPPTGTASATSTTSRTATATTRPTGTASSTATHTPAGSPTSTATLNPCRDSYEPDDQPGSAKLISTDGAAQQYTVHIAGDVDYAKFIAFQGSTYEIRTSELVGSGNDTQMILLAPDGNTILAGNDDDPARPPASRIVWTCPRSANYFIRVTQSDAGVGGCGISYALSVGQWLPPFTPASRPVLPLIVRGTGPS